MRQVLIVFLVASLISFSPLRMQVSLMGTSLSAETHSDEYQWVKEHFEKIVLNFPSIRINANVKFLFQAFSEIFGTYELSRFRNFIEKNPVEFSNMRTVFNQSVPIIPNGKTVAISGRSVVGLIHALLMVKMGYNVEIYDKRIEKTRNIQWALRQSLLDQIASISPELANEVMSSIAKPLHASVHLGADGSLAEYPPDSIRKPDPSLVPPTGEDMLKLPSVMTVECRKLEKKLEEFLKKYSTQVTLVNRPMEIYKLSSSEHFSVVGSNKDYEEIILAEGSHSENRTRAGIKSVRTTAARLQIAGEVQTPTLGRMVKFYRTENNDSMISYTMETMGADKVWLVADIHAESIEPDATFTRIVSESFIKGTVEYETEQRRLNDAFEQEKNRKILLEFRRLAGPLLGKSPDEMKKLKIGGAFEKSNLPSVFWLDQRISTKATEGDNLRLVGDAVGNATPTVGGGMQIGATSHLESAKNLYFNLELLHYSLKSRHISLSEYQEAKIVAIKKYDASVLQDTLSWHIQGVPDMYLHLQDGGVEINRLPEGHQHAEEFNIIVDELNKKLLETTPEAIVKLSRISAANYYHVPSSEIKTEAGMKKWIKKVKDWAYHDFVRKAFKLGLVKWYKHEVESPYHYLNEVLPQRPEKGLKFPSWMSNANIIPYKLHMNRCKTFYRADH